MNRPEPASWNERYLNGNTPWDLGQAHPELVRRVPELGEPGTAFIGGAGRAHDAVALAEQGWHVVATDWAPDAAGAAARLADLGSRYVVTDSLSYEDGPFDLVFEHTFFCAIDPADRAAYGAMANRLVRPGGRLAAVVFPVGKPPEDGGPPFGVSTGLMSATLGNGFRLEVDEPVTLRGHAGWIERWAVWRAN